MSVKNGNTAHEQRPTIENCGFAPGDVVAMTQAALRLPKLAAMSCRLYYAIGMPNEFLVKEVVEDPGAGICIKLFPCCSTMADRKKGYYRCDGHPIVYFTKVNFRRMPKAGDKSASIVLPIIGEIWRTEYREGVEEGERPEAPEFVQQIFGMESSLKGVFAKMAKAFFERQNAL